MSEGRAAPQGSAFLSVLGPWGWGCPSAAPDACAETGQLDAAEQVWGSQVLTVGAKGFSQRGEEARPTREVLDYRWRHG